MGKLTVCFLLAATAALAQYTPPGGGLKLDASGNLVVGTSVLLSAPTGGDDRPRIQAAMDALTAGGGTVRLPSGTYHITTALTPRTNVALIGDGPGTLPVTTPPDFTFTPNGGTWIDCGGAVNCFLGSGLRSVGFEGFGAQNFTGAAFSFGGDDIDGISMSYARNLAVVGSATLNGSDAGFYLNNIQHFNMEQINVYRVNTGLHVINQNSRWAGANSTIIDFYVFTYMKTVANGNAAKPGIWMECLAPATGTAHVLGGPSFIRPQVNSYSTEATGTHVLIQGSATCAVMAVSMVDADLEGTALYGVHADYLSHSMIGVSVGDPSITHGLAFDYHGGAQPGGHNVSLSAAADYTVTNQDPTNTFYGTFNLPYVAGAVSKGAWYDTSIGAFTFGGGSISMGDVTANSLRALQPITSPSDIQLFPDAGGSIIFRPNHGAELARFPPVGGIKLKSVSGSCGTSGDEGNLYYTSGTPGLWRVCTRETGGAYALHTIKFTIDP